MPRIFTRKQFSNYLGETRAIDDIITSFIPTPDPSLLKNFEADIPSTFTTYNGYNVWLNSLDLSELDCALNLINGPVVVPDYGGGLYCDGADNWFFSSAPAGCGWLTDSTWSLSLWIEPHDTYIGYQRIISTADQKFEVGISNGRIAIYTNGTWKSNLSGVLGVNQPTMITFTYNASLAGGRVVLKVNGPVPSLTTINSNGSVSPYLGSITFSSYYGGLADWFEATWYKIKYWNRELDIAEIDEIYNNEKSQYGY